MYRTPNRGKIQAKISSMPPQRSQATVYLNAYKKMVEKERLEQELQKLEARQHQIQLRLAVLYSEIVTEEKKMTCQQANIDLELVPTDNPATFNTLTLEY